MNNQTKIQVEFSHEIKGSHGFFEIIISGGKNSIPNPLTLIGDVTCLPHPTIKSLEGVPVTKVTKHMLSDYKIRKRDELEKQLLDMRMELISVRGTEDESYLELRRKRILQKQNYIDSLKELPLEPLFSIVEFTVEEPYSEEIIHKVKEATARFNEVLSKGFEVLSIHCEGVGTVYPSLES